MTEVHAYKFSNALVRKGFERVESKHHTMFYLAVGGTRTGIRTRISHGQRKVDDWLLGRDPSAIRVFPQRTKRRRAIRFRLSKSWKRTTRLSMALRLSGSSSMSRLLSAPDEPVSGRWWSTSGRIDRAGSCW